MFCLHFRQVTFRFRAFLAHRSSACAFRCKFSHSLQSLLPSLRPLDRMTPHWPCFAAHTRQDSTATPPSPPSESFARRYPMKRTQKYSLCIIMIIIDLGCGPAAREHCVEPIASSATATPNASRRTRLTWTLFAKINLPSLEAAAWCDNAIPFRFAATRSWTVSSSRTNAASESETTLLSLIQLPVIVIFIDWIYYWQRRMHGDGGNSSQS